MIQIIQSNLVSIGNFMINLGYSMSVKSAKSFPNV